MGQSPARQAIYRGTRSGQNVSDGHAPTPRGTSMLAGSTGLGPTGHEQQARNDQPLNRGQSGMSTPSAERLTPLEPKEEFTIGQNGHETITNGGQQHMNPLLATNPAAEAAMAAVAGLRTQRAGSPIERLLLAVPRRATTMTILMMKSLLHWKRALILTRTTTRTTRRLSKQQ